MHPGVIRTLLLAAAVLAATAAAVPALAQGAAVEGRATGTDGAPVPFAVVRLVPAAAGDSGAVVITDAEGRYRFAGLAPGDYRVRLDRIGVESTVTPPFSVGSGAGVRQDLRAAARPIQLPGLRTGEPRCLAGGELGADPALAALWGEAQKSARARGAFDRSYRYTYDRRQRGTVRMRLVSPRHLNRDSVVTSIPDSVTARAERRARERAATGYSAQTRRSFSVTIPDEQELLAPEFLDAHCLEASPQVVDGSWIVRFRPAGRARRGAIRGEIRIDSRSYAVDALHVEHLRGDEPFMRASVRFGDVAVPGGTVRLPVQAEFAGRPRGAVGLAVTAVQGSVSFHNHRGFERVVR
jgi:hypothetical protein